ncbi:MAG: allantoicase [Rhodobiaceae bacterium]|nr:allantoicase [Rhodobiaceae bacterium]
MSGRPNAELPDFARNGVNLASGGLGAVGVTASDQFFAPLDRMLSDAPAVFYPDRYDDHGKWMDGWETRRRRDGGQDWAIVKLAAPGHIHGFDIDTAHFTGNYPPACRIDACMTAHTPDDRTDWHEILPVSPLGPSAHHYYACSSHQAWSHIRITILPDGGVARLKVYGRPQLDPGAAGGEIDLAAALNGARVVAVSDAHYGDYHRILFPGRGVDMGDGWETRRRREPGNDWAIIKLATRGTVRRAVVDTANFKGNYPHSCALVAADLTGFQDNLDDAVVTSAMFWKPLLDKQKLSPDSIHEFAAQLADCGPITHVMLNIYPDGGVSRLKLFGHPA